MLKYLERCNKIVLVSLVSHFLYYSQLDMSRKKLDLLKLDKIPTWITNENIDYLVKPDFQRIARFFIINTPDKSISARGREIKDYGIDDEATLFKKIIGRIPYKMVLTTLEKSDLAEEELLYFPPSFPEERICYAYNNNKQVTSLFIKIRNALAHGRFNIFLKGKIPYLIMEDINSNDNCSARIILKFATLKHWIDILEKNM